MADEQILGEEDFNAAQALDLILDSKKATYYLSFYSKVEYIDFFLL